MSMQWEEIEEGQWKIASPLADLIVAEHNASWCYRIHSLNSPPFGTWDGKTYRTVEDARAACLQHAQRLLMEAHQAIALLRGSS